MASSQPASGDAPEQPLPQIHLDSDPLPSSGAAAAAATATASVDNDDDDYNDENDFQTPDEEKTHPEFHPSSNARPGGGAAAGATRLALTGRQEHCNSPSFTAPTHLSQLLLLSANSILQI